MKAASARVALALALLLPVAACGRKGPLYLPDSNGTVVTRPAPAPAPQQPAPQSSETPNEKPQ